MWTTFWYRSRDQGVTPLVNAIYLIYFMIMLEVYTSNFKQISTFISYQGDMNWASLLEGPANVPGVVIRDYVLHDNKYYSESLKLTKYSSFLCLWA